MNKIRDKDSFQVLTVTMRTINTCTVIDPMYCPEVFVIFLNLYKKLHILRAAFCIKKSLFGMLNI
jgi:dUTPase